MKQLSKYALIFGLSLGFFLTPLSADAAKQKREPDAKFYLIDLIVLNEGAVKEDRQWYREKVKGIAARYDIKQVQHYTVNSHMMGGVPDATELSIWEMPNPVVLQSMMKDPEYQAMIEKRNVIHNMDKVSMFLAKALQDGPQITQGPVLADFIVMNEGFTNPERDWYEARVKPIAAKYGMHSTRSYEIIKHMNGGINNAMRLNLWEMPSSESMSQLGADPAYQSLIERRNKIHNMQELTLYMVEPSE